VAWADYLRERPVGLAQNVGEEVWRRPRWFSPTALQIAQHRECHRGCCGHCPRSIRRCWWQPNDSWGNGRDQAERA